MGDDTQDAAVEELLAEAVEDCTGAAADDRRAMLRHLLDAGVPLDALRAGVAAGDPRQALVEYRILGDGPRHDLDAAARMTGLAPSVVAEVLRACGLPVPEPGEAVLSDADIEAVQIFGQVESFFGPEAVLRFSRVMSQSVSRVAEAAIAMFGVNVEDPLVARGGSQTELTETVDEALGCLWTLPALFSSLFTRHALDAARRMSLARADHISHGMVHVTVGFGDLVRSTEWTRDRTARELADALGEFDRLARGALVGDARVVKTIGDEVMFMAVAPADACRTALDLLASVGSEPRLPALRVGLAEGNVVALDGDLYGSVVNLAARLVQAAEPGHAVANTALAEAAGTDGLTFSPLAPVRLAGFEDPVVPYALARTA